MRRFVVLVMALAAGCGGDDGNKQQIDGGVDIDAPVAVDAPVNNGPVKLTITSNGAPMVGVRVHFTAPDSTVISSVDTDANGVASALMPTGGFVSAIDPFAGSLGRPTSEIKTFAGVKPGDDLKLSESYDSGSHDVMITVPRVTNDASITTYHFWTPCNEGFAAASSGSGASVSTTINVSDGCGTTTDVLVTTENSDNDVIGYIYQAAANTTAAVDLTGSTWAAPTNKTYTISNIPAAQGGASFDQILTSSNGRMYERPTGGSGTTVSGTLALPAFANAHSIGVTYAEGANGNYMLLDWGPLAATYNLDLGANLLVPATSAVTFDNATRTMSWSEGTGVAPDFVRASIYVSHEVPSPYDIDWEIVAPYAAGTVTWPTLPVEVLDYNIGASDPVGVGGVALIKVPGGYDAARPVIYTLEGPEAIGLSGTGSAAVEFIYPQQQLRTAKPAQKRGHSTWQTKHRM